MPRKRRAKSKASKQIIVARPRGPATMSLMSQSSVPAAVSSLETRREIQFRGIRSGSSSGICVSGEIPLYTIGASVTLGLGLVDLAGTRHATQILRPTDAKTLTPALALQAACWARYRVRSLTFKYNAIGSTASAVRLVFGFSCDPQCTSLYSVIDASGYNLIQTAGSSVAFSPWKSWKLRVPTDDNWKYVDPTASDTISSNIRQEAFGIIACVADSDPGTTYTYGTLSAEFSIEFLDMTVLPAASRPTYALSGGDSKSSNVDTLSAPTLVKLPQSESSSLPPDVVVIDHPQSAVSSIIRSPAPSVMAVRRS